MFITWLCKLLLLGLLGWSPGAQAQLQVLTSCDSSTGSNGLTINPIPASDIKVPGQVGAVLYRGVVSFAITCTVSRLNTTFVMGVGLGTSNSRANGSSNRISALATNHRFTATGCTMTQASTPFLGPTQSVYYWRITATTLPKCTITYAYDVTMGLMSLLTSSAPFPWAYPSSDANLYGKLAWVVIADNGLNVGYQNSVSTAAQFVPVGCTLSTTSLTLTLSSVPASSLAAAGSASPAQPFDITFGGCNGNAVTASATWSFTPMNGNNTVITNTASAPAANVGVQLLDTAAAPIADTTTTPVVSISNAGSFSGRFWARYYAMGPASPGAVQGIATFNVTYN